MTLTLFRGKTLTSVLEELQAKVAMKKAWTNTSTTVARLSSQPTM